MKILQAIASINPAVGGPVEGVLQTSRWSTAAGNQVEILTVDDPADPLVQSCPFRVHAVGPVGSTFGYTPRILRWLRANLQAYDIAVVNGLWQYLSRAVWKASRETGVPYVVFPHGMLDPYFKHAFPWKHRKKALYWRLFERRVLGDAAAVAFTCDQERLLARQAFPPLTVRESVVGYGTSEPNADLPIARETFLDAHPSLRGRRIALFIGRLHPKKGCDMLLQAFAAVLAPDPEWRLVMAGPDQAGLRPQLEAMARTLGIEDRVTWTGMLLDDLKWGAFAAAEIFALPSHQENFGIAVVEALACGLPVLISKQVNIWAEIEAAGAGLCSEDTLTGTSSLLAQWISMGEQAKAAMRAATRRCFLEHFEAEATSAMLDSLLARCITDARRS
ncbi:MAG TPA: glycosyltransferase [Acidisarcina sp.]